MEENKETLDLGFAKLDLQRQQRCGFPEVVYCAGKTVDQSVRILDILMEKYDNVIGTRPIRPSTTTWPDAIRLPNMMNWPVWSISIRTKPSSMATASFRSLPPGRAISPLPKKRLDGGNHGQPR